MDDDHRPEYGCLFNAAMMLGFGVFACWVMYWLMLWLLQNKRWNEL